MDAQAALRSLLETQAAFKTLTILQLTAYLYPKPAIVQNESIFDFGIIGGGTAGCVLAKRLAEDGKTKVLLIEAGGDPPVEANFPSLLVYLQNTSTDWNYTSTLGKTKSYTRKTNKFDLALGKMLGGSSACNYILYDEGSHLDYDSWAIALNDSNWSGASVLPYFIKSQCLEDPTIQNSPDRKYFGYDGPIILTKDKTSQALELLKAFKELGYPITTNSNFYRTVGYTTAMYNIGKGRRQHTAYSYLQSARKYSNLYVLKNTLATKIIFDKKKQAVAIQVVTKDNKVYILNVRKEIIVSAGTINTPKLLMLSGIGPKKHLQSKNIKVISDLPVGKNYIDQTSVTIIHKIPGLSLAGLDSRNPNVYPAAVVTGFISLNGSKWHTDYQTVSFFNYRKYFLMYSTLTYEYNDKITNFFFGSCKEEDLEDAYSSGFLFTLVTNLRPKSRGEVLLVSSNYSDPPLVRSGQNSDENDLDNLVQYIEDFVRVKNTKTFKKFKAVRLDPPLPECQKFKKGSHDYWKCYILNLTNSRRNYIGTCAMGSVVDGNFFVKGVHGLRVVDASVIPNPLSAATLPAVVMLAEKASDMIKQKHNL